MKSMREYDVIDTDSGFNFVCKIGAESQEHAKEIIRNLRFATPTAKPHERYETRRLAYAVRIYLSADHTPMADIALGDGGRPTGETDTIRWDRIDEREKYVINAYTFIFDERGTPQKMTFDEYVGGCDMCCWYTAADEMSKPCCHGGPWDYCEKVNRRIKYENHKEEHNE